MKKTMLLLFALMLVLINTFAQNQQIIIGKNYANLNEVTLAAERGVATTLKFDLNELNLIEVETDYGMMNLMTSAKAPVILEAGVPELIYLPAAIIIPDAGASELDIVYGEYTEFENIEIAPSKGNISRSIDPATVPYVKGEVYYQDAFFPGTLATLNEPFIMRDVRGQTLFVYPVQYNPVTKVLRVYSEMTITVNNTSETGINELTTQKKHNTIDPTFQGMYNNLFMNYSSLTRAYPTGEDGELLIICHGAFMDAMKPYIDWKRTIGRKTTMVSTAETGTTADGIKNYVSNYYNDPNNNLAYILLVGDHAQVPTQVANNPYGSSSAGDPTIGTDLYYGQLVGTDPYLEVLVGRFSAETVAHVQTQVQRSIHYERDLTTTDAWVGTGIGIAANEGTGSGHDGGEADYVHMNNVRNRLLAYGYNPVWQEYSGNCPGVPSTSASQMSQRFNAGAGMTNFCNHGSVTSWSVGNYSNSHVNQLQNAGKLSFIYSVACLNGRFFTATCFAEAWMRASQNNQPTGAVAVFMATISIGWQPPMSSQDEFVDLCMDTTHTAGGYNYGLPNHTIRTIAGVMLNASQKMIQRHGASGKNLYDFNSWLVFGDPTLQFRTKIPQEMTVSHLPLIPLGASEFSVDCDADGAVATVSYIDDDDEVIILGSAVVIDGVAEIVFDEPVTLPGEITIAVTGFNKVTYLGTIQAGGDLELPEPKNLSFVLENANHVVLTWEEPEDRGLTIKGYNVYRNDELITQELVKDEVTFTDVVPQNGEYKYEVTAIYGSTLESDPSNPVTLVIDGMCIPIGSNIILEEIEDTDILISWEAPQYEGIELAGYNVYRDATQINTEMIPATTLSFLDETLEIGTRYCYQVAVVYNDCEDPLMTEEVCLTLSVNDFYRDQKFSIFPNPTTGNITIEGEGLSRVEIYDLQGRKLAEYINLSGSLIINDMKCESGIYFVKMFSATDEVAVKRLVVIK